MFSLTLESPEVVRILNTLKEEVSIFPVEVTENSIEIATMDDGKRMVIWIYMAPDMLGRYEFEGDGRERFVVASDIFMKVLKDTAYPIEMGSLLDGSVKVNSANGRQVFRVKTTIDKSPESSDYHRNKFASLLEDGDYIGVKTLKQDLLEGLRTASVAGEDVEIELDGDVLHLTGADAEVDADAFVPIIEKTKEKWKHSYNIKLMKFLLEFAKDNVEVDLYLFKDSDTLLANLPIRDGSFCKVALAANQTRAGAEEGVSEEDA